VQKLYSSLIGLRLEWGIWIQVEGGDRISIIPWKPLDEMTTLRREMDTHWGRFFPEKTFHERYETHEWMASIDLKETKDKLLIKAELPGLEAKDVDLSIIGDILTIRGEKKKEAETKDEHFFCVERYEGTFERQIRLPANVKTGKVDAKFNKGVLTITLPKTEEAKKKEIKIKVH
jgi:HSP20 family protein